MILVNAANIDNFELHPKKRINKYLEKTMFVTQEKMNVTFCRVNGVLVKYNKLFETNLLVTYLLY